MEGYKITYSPVGTVASGRTDYVVVWSKDLKTAIEDFEALEIEQIIYNQHAIVQIELYTERR